MFGIYQLFRIFFVFECIFLFQKRIDGLIVSNTTLHRPGDLISKYRNESGGLSGRPLKDQAQMVLERMYELTNGELIMIGVGGIENGRDALERIKSGASLIQIYTSMVYQGPVVINRIRKELIYLLK
jgi:dihydroorotate dehydrogenase